MAQDRKRIDPWTIAASAAAILAASAAYLAVWFQHQDAKELIRVQVSIEMTKLFDSAEMKRARSQFATELIQRKTPRDISDTPVLDFFETLAAHREQGRIDDDTLYANFSYSIQFYWIAAKDLVLSIRKDEDDKELYTGFEELNEAIQKMNPEARKKAIARMNASDGRIKRFLNDERGLVKR